MGLPACEGTVGVWRGEGAHPGEVWGRVQAEAEGVEPDLHLEAGPRAGKRGSAPACPPAIGWRGVWWRWLLLAVPEGRLPGGSCTTGRTMRGASCGAWGGVKSCSYQNNCEVAPLPLNCLFRARRKGGLGREKLSTYLGGRTGAKVPWERKRASPALEGRSTALCCFLFRVIPSAAIGARPGAGRCPGRATRARRPAPPWGHGGRRAPGGRARDLPT